MTKAEAVLENLARDFRFDKETLLKESLKSFLEKKLVEVQAEIFKLGGKYGVKSSKEIDRKYEEGGLEEKDTWEDYFRLDHLEYRRDRIAKMLKELN